MIEYSTIFEKVLSYPSQPTVRMIHTVIVPSLISRCCFVPTTLPPTGTPLSTCLGRRIRIYGHYRQCHWKGSRNWSSHGYPKEKGSKLWTAGGIVTVSVGCGYVYYVSSSPRNSWHSHEKRPPLPLFGMSNHNLMKRMNFKTENQWQGIQSGQNKSDSSWNSWKTQPVLSILMRTSPTTFCSSSTLNSNRNRNSNLNRNSNKVETENPNVQKQNETGSPTVSIRRRMTSIGQFALQSETATNLSIPTFFLYLVDDPSPTSETPNHILPSSPHKNQGGGGGMTKMEFESLWLQRQMFQLHPRFQSQVEQLQVQTQNQVQGQTVLDKKKEIQEETHISRKNTNMQPKQHSYYFVQSHRHPSLLMMNQNIYVKDTIHTSHHPYSKVDLAHRIEYLLTHPLNVTQRLWEVYISSGPLGSAGILFPSSLTFSFLPNNNNSSSNNNNNNNNSHRTESLLLFRAHHSLADAVSILAALTDFVDEADQIQDQIQQEWKKQTRKQKSKNKFSFFYRWIYKLCTMISFLVQSVQTTLQYLILFVQTFSVPNPFLQVLQVNSWEEATMKRITTKANNPSMNGNHPELPVEMEKGHRNVSWCHVDTVDQVKTIAKRVGSKITLNDVFVSCVSKALARQFEQHRQWNQIQQDAKLAFSSSSSSKSSSSLLSSSSNENELQETKAKQTHHTLQEKINVVIPVHLYGGINIPGTEIGNRIGAFVARIPCESKSDTSLQKEDAWSESTNHETNQTTSLQRHEFSSIQRLQSVHSSLQAMKNSPAPILSYYFAKFITSYLPHAWVSSMFRHANANAAVAITNSRGFPHKVHIHGRSVEAAIGFLPLPPGIPVGIVIQSYNNMVSLSLTAEPWAVPNADEFLEWIVEEYETLKREVKVKSERLDGP